MTKKWSLAAAFDHFGAAGANRRWSWSARSPDGQVVVMTLWRDEFDYSTKPPTYSSFDNQTEAWTDRPGNHERIANLLWAREHCGGKLRVVITVAEDVNAQPRTIASCFPHETMVAQLTELNETTGEFRAVITSAT
jgi:hypothetical protein